MSSVVRKIQLFSPLQVERMLNRLAYEVIERNRGVENLEVVGIRQRGSRLAVELARRMGEVEGRVLPVHALDITAFRDDRPREMAAPPPLEAPVDVTDRDILLVDDVLFTGRTVRAALDALARYGRPRTVQLAVLIDRGHREYPIQPDYVGRVVPTKYTERVEVIPEPPFGVYLMEALPVEE